MENGIHEGYGKWKLEFLDSHHSTKGENKLLLDYTSSGNSTSSPMVLMVFCSLVVLLPAYIWQELQEWHRGNNPQSEGRSFGKWHGTPITTCSAKLADIFRAIIAGVHSRQNMTWGTSMSGFLQKGFDDAQGYNAVKNLRGARQRWEAFKRSKNCRGTSFKVSENHPAVSETGWSRGHSLCGTTSVTWIHFRTNIASVHLLHKNLILNPIYSPYKMEWCQYCWYTVYVKHICPKSILHIFAI